MVHMRGTLATLIAAALLCGPLPFGARAQAPGEHPVGVRVVDGQGEFYVRATGERWVPRGANYAFLPRPDGTGMTNEIFRIGVYDPDMVRADFALLAERGFDLVRVFLDTCQGQGCIAPVGGIGLDPAYLANVADMTHVAAQNGLLLLPTSNDLPDDGGYSQEANAGAGATFAGYRNSFYLTPGAVNATRRYWRDLITGLREQGARFDAILAWQLLNEQWMFADQPPLSLTSGLVTTTTGTYDMADADEKARMVSDGLVHYIASLRQEILALDRSALLTMGFFLPGVAPGWYVETASLMERADLDFFDFHTAPGQVAFARSLARHARIFGMLGQPERPVLMGELAAFRSRYETIDSAARDLTAWVAESCAFGFDGWLLWTYRAADASWGDQTWGMTDADGLLLDLLSPAAHPDPCVAAVVPNADLAVGRRVRASASLKGSPPGLAVDDDASTGWSAGGHAPQWIAVDLGRPRTVGEVRLLVDQWPAGPTRHLVEVRRAGWAGFRTVGRLQGRTDSRDTLVFRPERPLRDVREVRVRTVRSPSWVAWLEISVFESPQEGA